MLTNGSVLAAYPDCEVWAGCQNEPKLLSRHGSVYGIKALAATHVTRAEDLHVSTGQAEHARAVATACKFCRPAMVDHWRPFAKATGRLHCTFGQKVWAHACALRMCGSVGLQRSD